MTHLDTAYDLGAAKARAEFEKRAAPMPGAAAGEDMLVRQLQAIMKAIKGGAQQGRGHVVDAQSYLKGEVPEMRAALEEMGILGQDAAGDPRQMEALLGKAKGAIPPELVNKLNYSPEAVQGMGSLAGGLHGAVQGLGEAQAMGQAKHVEQALAAKAARNRKLLPPAILGGGALIGGGLAANAMRDKEPDYNQMSMAYPGLYGE